MSSTKIRTFGGNIGIGTNNPGNYRLRVEGAVKTTSLVIDGVTNAFFPSGAIAIWTGTLASIPNGWVLCNGANGTPNLSNRFVRGADGDTTGNAIKGGTGGNNSVLLAETNLPSHSHPISLQYNSAAHGHWCDGNYVPHSHQGSGHNHTHNLYAISWRRLNGWDNFNFSQSGVGGWAIWPVSNNVNAATDQGGDHSHYFDANNAPHTHGSRYSNAPHSHTVTTGQTGTASNNNRFNIEDKYYNVFYIMKT